MALAMLDRSVLGMDRNAASPRLTELAHGGGCGCKLSTAVLRDLLAAVPKSFPDPRLLVSIETEDDSAALCEAGYVTGASHRNCDSYGTDVEMPAELPVSLRHLLTDAQTSGGLLVACDPAATLALVRRLHDDGFARAAAIGAVEAGFARIFVRRD
jgi:selenophosphate synthase